jgi:tetratricopeptide (TPR) repeat protein
MMLTCLNLDGPGQWFLQQDNLLEAMYCYQMMTATQTLLGFRDWRLSTAWTNLSQCYSKLGRKSDAVFAERQARDLMCALTGEDSVNVCLLDAELAESMVRNGETAEAERLLRVSLSQVSRLKEPAPLAKAYILRTLIDTYIEERKYQQALECTLQLIPLDDGLQQSISINTFGARSKLVEIYCLTGRLAEAESLARQTVKQYEPLDNSLTKACAHDSLARVLVLLGKTEDARREFDATIALLSKGYGPADQKVAYWRARYDKILTEKKPYSD